MKWAWLLARLSAAKMQLGDLGAGKMQFTMGYQAMKLLKMKRKRIVTVSLSITSHRIMFYELLMVSET